MGLPRPIFLALFVPVAISAALIPSQDGTVVYDTATNVSWLANVNLPNSNRFGLPVCTNASDIKTCVNASGSMAYQAAAAWVTAMNAAGYLGHGNWQIPTTPILDNTCSFVGPQNNSFGWGCGASAFGSLYYALGFSAPNSAVPVPNIKVGPFSNFQPDLYWSGTSLPQPTGGVGCCGTFSFNSGWQGSNIAANFLFLLPMIPGKILGTSSASGTALQINPGGQTVYDPIANVTWLADANVAASIAFGLPACTDPSPKSCVNSNGAMNFNSAVQFIKNMNAASYLGQTNWQIPPVDPNCAAGYVCSVATAPFQSLYYTQLGLAPGTPVVTAPNLTVGSFTNIRPYLYWTCEASTIQQPCQTAGPAPGFEWSYWFGNGFEGTDVLAHDMYVTAYFVGAPANLCTYSLSAGGQAFNGLAGTGVIAITTTPTCPWSVGALPPWITLTSASSGVGSGTVTFNVAPNLSLSSGDLSAAITIAGQTFTVEQAGGTTNFVGSMPHLAAGNGWSTTFTYVNKGATPATARTLFYAADGTALTLPANLPDQPSIAGLVLASQIDQTVNPNASAVLQALGPAGEYQEGSAQFFFTPGSSLDGFAIFHFDPTNQDAVVPLQALDPAPYLLAFDNTNGVLTGVALETVPPIPANIPVTIRNDTGAIIKSASISLPGFGHTSFVLSTQFPQTANIRGTIEFDLPPPPAPVAQIAALGIRYTAGTTTTIPALAGVGTTGGSMAHLASGNGWQTTFALVNTGTAAATATLKFFDNNGIPLSLPLTFPQGGTATTVPVLNTPSLAPGASYWVQSGGPLKTALLTGSAQLTTTGKIGGFVIFRYNPNGQEAVVPLESRNASSYLIAFDNTSKIATGIAIANASPVGISVPVTLRDYTGAQIGSPTSISLNGNGHASFVLTDQFPAAANLRGTVEFDAPAGTQISVLGIRSPPALTFTTLPPLAK